MNKYHDKLFYNASSRLFENARGLRKELTKAEMLLWAELRHRKLGGWKFRRQHPIDKYVADFYCAEHKVIIELDGGIHQETEIQQYDIARTTQLEQLGIRVLRFKNEEVELDIQPVLMRIVKFINNQ